MRTTQYALFTLKNNPNQSKIISHQLMIRAGMIRKLSSGIYSWLPTGIRVLKKIENIIREEMNKSNALEIVMPIIQPKVLWNKSKRLNLYGNELFQLLDRRNRTFVLSPTHEEVITQLISSNIHSYKQLPITLYQIQTKFRDEIRPKFGIIRSREFIMKDAYSFHMHHPSLLKTYELMQETYIRIFKRMKLKFCVVKADSSLMGGKISHEFQTFSKNGENTIIISKKSQYAANIEIFSISKNTIPNSFKEKENIQNIKIEKHPETLTLTNKMLYKKNKFVKTLLVKSSNQCNYPWIILLIRNDHKIDLFKIKKITIIGQPFTIASNQEIKSLLGKESNSLGPIGLSFPIVADITVSKMKNFIVGANIDNKTFSGVNWHRDLPLPIVADIQNITKDKILYNNKNNQFEIKNSIEIAHIFQIGNNYSKTLNASIKNNTGISCPILMGCYGIGISRTIAAIIEQNHDDRGIIWPDSVSPFQICILPINMYNSLKVKETSEYIYKILKENTIDVLFDDRKEQPGNMFAEIELIGIPHCIIISNKNIQENKVEYRNRHSKQCLLIQFKNVISFLLKTLKTQI